MIKLFIVRLQAICNLAIDRFRLLQNEPCSAKLAADKKFQKFQLLQATWFGDFILHAQVPSSENN